MPHAGETPASRYDFTPHTPAEVSDAIWSLCQAGAVWCTCSKDQWLRKLHRGGPQTVWTATARGGSVPAAFVVVGPGADFITEYGGEFDALRALLAMLVERGERGGVSLVCHPGLTEPADFFWTHAEWVSPELCNIRIHHLERLMEAYRPIWTSRVPDGESATLVMHRGGTEQRCVIGAPRGMGVSPMRIEGVSPSRNVCATSRGQDVPGTHGRDAHATGGELHLGELQMVRLLFGPWPPSMVATLPPRLQWLGQIFPLPFGVPIPAHV